MIRWMMAPSASLILLLLAFSGSLVQAEKFLPPAAGEKPHIVMILVDDWGWANVGYHRQTPTKEVQTPNFDSLCKQGIELDQHYAYKFCSPSRSSLMSGRLPIHVNILNAPPDIYNPADPVSGFAAIPRNMTGVASKLKSAGYATHHVGKWDAGMATPDHTPTGRGFDTTFGYFHHDNDYYTEKVGKVVTVSACVAHFGYNASQGMKFYMASLSEAIWTMKDLQPDTIYGFLETHKQFARGIREIGSGHIA